jgi:hypothetical protein
LRWSRCPAGRQHDVIPQGQRFEAGIAIDLENAAEAFEMRRRPLGPPIRTVSIENRRRIVPAPGPVVPCIDPEPPSAGPATAGIEHWQYGIIGKDPIRRHHMIGDPVPDRGEPPGSARHPVRQRRAVQRDPLAGEDLALPVKRQVIAIFADQDM